jgi:hypothetical protein
MGQRPHPRPAVQGKVSKDLRTDLARGIEKYLGSGMIRGIGPVYAKKLVRAFGEKVFDTIEGEPERRTDSFARP